MFNVPVAAMQNQKPRFIAPGRWILRDQFRRQGKIKVGGSHFVEFQGSGLKIQAVAQRS